MEPMTGLVKFGHIEQWQWLEALVYGTVNKRKKAKQDCREGTNSE